MFDQSVSLFHFLAQAPDVVGFSAQEASSFIDEFFNFFSDITTWPEKIGAFLLKTAQIFMVKTIWINLWKTTQMVLIAGAFTILFGVPLGVWVNLTDKHGLKPNAGVNKTLGIIINIGRSIPFIIFCFILMAVSKLVLGTSIGVKGAIIPLTVSAIPFMARLTESALKEVPQGLIEAAHSMGATPFQIIRKVLLPEALPGIISAMTIMLVSMIDYSAMAGFVGAGGLGDYAINHGFQRGRWDIILAAVIVIVLMVQITQWVGDWLARKVDHR